MTFSSVCLIFFALVSCSKTLRQANVTLRYIGLSGDRKLKILHSFRKTRFTGYFAKLFVMVKILCHTEGEKAILIMLAALMQSECTTVSTNTE